MYNKKCKKSNWKMYNYKKQIPIWKWLLGSTFDTWKIANILFLQCSKRAHILNKISCGKHANSEAFLAIWSLIADNFGSKTLTSDSEFLKFLTDQFGYYFSFTQERFVGFSRQKRQKKLEWKLTKSCVWFSLYLWLISRLTAVAKEVSGIGVFF